jgi:hypothetical protein
MVKSAFERVEDLSDREQKCLDHLRQSRDLGVSFAELLPAASSWISASGIG